MTEDQLLERITKDPAIFGGKPVLRSGRLAVEHVISMLAAGDDNVSILEGYGWMVREDIQACLAYALRHLTGEPIEPAAAGGPGG